MTQQPDAIDALFTIDNPDVELSDAAIDSLARLLVELVEEEPQTQDANKSGGRATGLRKHDRRKVLTHGLYTES